MDHKFTFVIHNLHIFSSKNKYTYHNFFLQGRNLGHCQDVAADSTVPRKGHTATTPQRNHIATTWCPHHDHITTMVTLQHQLQADASAEFIIMDHSAKPACRKRPQILRIGVAGEFIIINVDRTDGDAYRGSFL